MNTYTARIGQPDIAPPATWMLLAESRALAELFAHFATRSLLKLKAPRGDGHAVMTLPGLGADDQSMKPMRGFLRELGYSAHPWRLGRNLGREHIGAQLSERLDQIRHRSGGPVSLVGWSMGGIYARELAKARPDAVRSVITLGTPFTGSPLANSVTGLYRLLSGKEPHVNPRWHTLRVPPPHPTTSIYSSTDGIVHWRCSINEPGDRAENIHVQGSHCGLGHHPAALYAVADRLAQRPDDWQPFRPQGIARLLYRDHR